MKYDKSGELGKFKQLVVRVRSYDDPSDNGTDVVVADGGSTWATLITLSPIRKGSKLALDLEGRFIATAEVTDWVWDYWGDTVRVSVLLVEKNENWPVK